MCGIAGYVGPQSAVGVVFDQLRRLEYRGYDSAGIAYLEGDEIQVLKRAGKLNVLGSLLGEEHGGARMAIAHSRWATHGAPTDTNAHPHLDRYEQVAIIHNGIIENYLDHKEELLARGHVFHSETDTEVAAHVIGEEYAKGVPLEEAVRRAVKKFQGAYALVVFSKTDPGKIVATRSASPLVVGLGKGENMLASDIPALLPYTREVLVLDDDRVCILRPDRVEVTDLDGNELDYDVLHVDWDIDAAEKGGYEHFMLKEIMEQPTVMKQALAGRLCDDDRVHLDLGLSASDWGKSSRLVFVACGTSYNASLMAKSVFEGLLRIPCDVYYASEFRYGDPILAPDTICFFVSQSGETADSLAALNLCKAKGLPTIGIVNVMGSSIARECAHTILTQAGPEISVASTKAYTAQVLTMILVALHVAQDRPELADKVQSFIQALHVLPAVTTEALKSEPAVMNVAEHARHAEVMFFLGRGVDAYVSLEGALKMKEIAYIPTQEIPAGEMKHGPLALVSPTVYSIFGLTEAKLRDKTLSNMREIQARRGEVIAVTTADDRVTEKFATDILRIPNSGEVVLDALVSNVILQLLAYHVARLRGCDIDQPRNLAKSVTVE